MGAWIETFVPMGSISSKRVAPRVGAWIETEMGLKQVTSMESHPVWVRGLKLGLVLMFALVCMRRTPCGCVD